MMKDSEYLRDLIKLGFAERVYCDKTESKLYEGLEADALPDDVHIDVGTPGMPKYYRYGEVRVPDGEMKNVLLARIAVNVKTIKNCAVFFTVAAVVALLIGLAAAFVR